MQNPLGIFCIMAIKTHGNLSYLYLYWFINVPKCEKSQSSESYNTAPLGICAWYDMTTWQTVITFRNY